jgi:LacI family transcriptional regulator
MTRRSRKGSNPAIDLDLRKAADPPQSLISAPGNHPASRGGSVRTNAGRSQSKSPVPAPRTRRLGLLVSDLTNPFFPELVQAFEDQAANYGYEVVVAAMSHDHNRVRRCLRNMRERNIEGAAIMTFGEEEPHREDLARQLHDIPLVYIDDAPPCPHACSLRVDYQRGIREAVQHLATLGHRKLAFISGSLTQLSAQLRREAFLQSAREAGCIPRNHWLFEGNHTIESGMRGMERILARKPLPTAVVCSNDLTAIGAIRALARSGIDVPEGMSVLGFDDIYLAEFVNPPLTTIRMSPKGLARAAVEALRSRIENPQQAIPRMLLQVPTTLILRRSTSHPPRTEPITAAPVGPEGLSPTRKRRA